MNTASMKLPIGRIVMALAPLSVTRVRQVYTRSAQALSQFSYRSEDPGAADCVVPRGTGAEAGEVLRSDVVCTINMATGTLSSTPPAFQPERRRTPRRSLATFPTMIQSIIPGCEGNM